MYASMHTHTHTNTRARSLLTDSVSHLIGYPDRLITLSVLLVMAGAFLSSQGRCHFPTPRSCLFGVDLTTGTFVVVLNFRAKGQKSTSYRREGGREGERERERERERDLHLSILSLFHNNRLLLVLHSHTHIIIKFTLKSLSVY